MKTISTMCSTTWNFLKNESVRTWNFALAHKIASGVVVLIIIGGGYWGYTTIVASTGNTQYIIARAIRAPLIVTVTGSGQVSAKDTLNLTPQASGKITYLGVTPGQKVTAGTLIAQLDMTTAAQAVTTARQNLKSAQISYQQTLTSSGSSVTNDQTSLATAQTNAATALTTTYTGLPSILNGLDGILHNLSTITNYGAQQNIDAYADMLKTTDSFTYRNQVIADYAAAVAGYQTTKGEYALMSPATASIDQIQKLNQDTLATNKLIETALKDTLAYYNYVNDQITASKITSATQLSTQLTSLSTYQTTLTSDDASITNAQSTLTTAQQAVIQDTQSLNNTGTPLTVQSAELNVEKAQESLTEALTNESNYIIRAPFDGVIATVPVNKYDQASSGTTIATLITTEEYADLSLNETDAAKVQVGQPVNVTFDAIPGLTLPGTVAVVNPVGTVSQGVVTYDVKISFSQQDPRVKPGMTATAIITTATEPNAIQVPSAAIKTSGGTLTIQVATLLNASTTLANAYGGTAAGTGTRRTRSATSTAAFGTGGFSASSTFSGMSGSTPITTRSLTVPASQVTLKTVTVTTGLSNDTMTEVLTGLTQGQYVVTATQNTAANTTKSSAASATSLFGGSSGTRGLGGITGGSGYGGGTHPTTGATPAATTKPGG